MHEMFLIVRRRPRWRQAGLTLSAFLLLAVGARALGADACSSCAEPVLADLEALPGFTLHALPPDIFGHQPTDYFEIDAGECTYKPLSDPKVEVSGSRLVLRGMGEVWNCPESSSDDEISFSIASGDSTEWSLEGEVGGTLKAVALEFAAKVKGSVGGGRSLTEVKSVRKTLRAAEGHRIPWEGLFEVVTLSMNVEFGVTRRWSWWTKNKHTEYVVLRSGTIDMGCGSEKVTLSRNASIGYRLHLFDVGCGHPGAPRDLGFFPPYTPPPTTDGDKKPAPGETTSTGNDAAPPPNAPPPAPAPTPAPPPVPAPAPAPGGMPAEPPEGTTPRPGADGATPPVPPPEARPPEPVPGPMPLPDEPTPNGARVEGMAPTGPIPDPMAPPWNQWSFVVQILDAEGSDA